MPSANRIYLDNAATSWPKPEAVYQAMDRYQRQLGVAAGRGSYRDAESVSRAISQTRLRLAKLIGGHRGEHIVFTLNCTDALNLALHGSLRPGDHVVTTVAEHNSILRPLNYLADQRGIESTRVPLDEHGIVVMEELEKAFRETTRLVAVTHASNVTGAEQPIEEIGRIAHAHDCRLLVDAAQTVGHVPIDVNRQHIDFLAAPGHKGLLGPLGVGWLYLADGLEHELDPVRQGGTGTNSEDARQPDTLPAKYESGNLNVPGIVGLAAGIEHVSQHDSPSGRYLVDLTTQLVDAFSEMASVTTYSTPNACGIVSFNMLDYDPREVASLLDSIGGIQVRSGLHCAPLMHRALGTFDLGGTVRVSCGHFTTSHDVQQLVTVLRNVASS